jgi:hypothetical protein
MDFLRESAAPLVWIISAYILMLVLGREKADLESTETQSIPWIGISLCAVGFAVIGLFYVYEPSWIGANPIVWIWIVAFTLVWAIGSTSLGLLRLSAILGHFLLVSSQLSTDITEPWLKGLIDPHSPAIATLSTISLTLIFSGFHAGEQLRRFFGSSHSAFSISYTALVLLGAASVGLCAGGLISFGVWVVGAIV